MCARLTFLGITAFWVTMNVLLWRVEFGARGGDTPVPAHLVWHKILTAPDASSLSVYQKGERMGYCEFSTGRGPADGHLRRRQAAGRRIPPIPATCCTSPATSPWGISPTG